MAKRDKVQLSYHDREAILNARDNMDDSSFEAWRANHFPNVKSGTLSPHNMDIWRVLVPAVKKLNMMGSTRVGNKKLATVLNNRQKRFLESRDSRYNFSKSQSNTSNDPFLEEYEEYLGRKMTPSEFLEYRKQRLDGS